jgi:hypothetical protein
MIIISTWKLENKNAYFQLFDFSILDSVSPSLLVVQNCHMGFEITLVRDVIVVGWQQPIHFM